jgi:rubrerythrin
MLNYAIAQEKKMADFYRSFETIFPQGFRRAYIQGLVTQEEAHANKLMIFYS